MFLIVVNMCINLLGILLIVWMNFLIGVLKVVSSFVSVLLWVGSVVIVFNFFGLRRLLLIDSVVIFSLLLVLLKFLKRCVVLFGVLIEKL